MKVFAAKWCQWIDTFVCDGRVGVKMNNDIGLQTRKGRRQGDPLSHILFKIVANMVAVLIRWAKEAVQVGGLIQHLVNGGVSILHYTDDTIIFMEHGMVKAKNMKLIICLFEQLSGLKVNFHKSGLLYFGKAKEEETSTSNFLAVRLAHFLVGTLAFQCIFRSSCIRNGSVLKTALRRS